MVKLVLLALLILGIPLVSYSGTFDITERTTKLDVISFAALNEFQEYSHELTKEGSTVYYKGNFFSNNAQEPGTLSKFSFNKAGKLKCVYVIYGTGSYYDGESLNSLMVLFYKEYLQSYGKPDKSIIDGEGRSVEFHWSKDKMNAILMMYDTEEGRFIYRGYLFYTN